MEPVDIVLVSWYRPLITELTIRTIFRNTKRENYRLIVIDNGSPYTQQQMLRTMHGNGYIDELILNETNLGLEPARNQGLAMVKSKHFICADNDCLPEPMSDGTDWVEKLVALMEKYPTYAAISCRTQVMVGSGNIFENVEDQDIVGFPHPGGSLRIMRTGVVLQVGGWRNDVDGRGAEERYICGELNKIGYMTAFAVQIRTLHLFGTRGRGRTDHWGYDKTWEPARTGHSNVSHPALTNGDSLEDVAAYTSDDIAKEYFNGISNY